MVNVTKANFLEQSNDLLQHLPTAAFVAIDEEMTGINLPGSKRPAKDDTPQDRYQANKTVPERYSIIQLGVALFHQHPDYTESSEGPEFQVRRYNFYLFPPSSNDITREVTMNPSSVAFLNEHNMNFDMWTKEGIPFVTTAMADSIVKKYQNSRVQQETPAVKDPTRRRIELHKTEDINFHARALASLREWIDSAVAPGTSFLLPPCNRFLRRALYESIELEYPALILENAGPANRDQIRVWRLSPEEKLQREERLRREAWEAMVNEVGFWRVFRAISNACRGVREVNSLVLASSVNQVDAAAEPQWEPIGRKIPVVVHNGLMDFLFMLTHFHSHTLPDTFQETKALIAEYFPLIYDTKIMSTECLPQNDVGENNSTTLGNLYSKFVENDQVFFLLNRLQVVDAVGDDPSAADQIHEAAYDAYMTGAVFIALSKRIQIVHDVVPQTTQGGVAGLHHLLASPDNEIEKELFGRNKLYLMLTLYTVDLENPTGDPLSQGMSPPSTFRVSGSDPSVTTSDIVRCLANLTDTERHFEIVWVDDCTFMVAARSKGGNGLLERFGQEIQEALKRRFPTADICTLEEHLKAKEATEKSEERSMWSAFWGLFGYRKRGNDGFDGNEPNPKRRRVS